MAYRKWIGAGGDALTLAPAEDFGGFDASLEGASFIGGSAEAPLGVAYDVSGYSGKGSDFVEPLYFQPPTDGVAPNGKEYYNWDEAAAQLTRLNLSWSNPLGGPATVTYGFRLNDPGAAIMPGDSAGFSQFNQAQIEATEIALLLWADMANITFVRVGTGSTGPEAYSDSATILFGNYSSGLDGASAWGYYPFPGATGDLQVQGDVWVNSNFAESMNPVFGGYGPHLLAHEIGHAIGLQHPGDYDATNGGPITYADHADYFQDSRAYTTMSYFGSGVVGHALGNFAAGPQLHDIAAVQRLYGANMNTRTGDTVYGVGSNTGFEHYTVDSTADRPIFAVWDAGGIDTFDFSIYASNMEIDLREEAFSSVGAGSNGVGFAIGNISIARGAVIENAIAGSGNDTLIGNAADNTLTGNAGADSLNGGDGFDTASYYTANAGVTARLATPGSNIGDAAGDTYVSIEAIRGSQFNDTLSGDAGNNELYGENGADLLQGLGGNDVLFGGINADTLQGGDNDDILIGGAGADVLAGGAGFDTADYSTSGEGVGVSLQTGGSIYGGDAQGDTLGSIEAVIGSAFDDQLNGRDYVSNTLDGGDGDDTIEGGYGADTLIGGNGVDVLFYGNSLTGVDVRLFNNFAAGGQANGDVISGFEIIFGSFTATDTLAGDDNVNEIYGGGGNETMTGRGGNDHLFGEDGNDTVLGGAGEDVLYGSLGNDTFGGGADDDTVDFSDSSGAVTVNLATGAGSGGHAQGDTFVSIERVIGSDFGDVIIGKANAWNNYFDGRGGNDTITGGLGNDTFVFRNGDGSDTITDFAAGNASGDVVQFRSWDVAFDTFAEVMGVASQQGANVVFNFGNGQTLTLNNVTLGNLNAGDFLFA